MVSMSPFQVMDLCTMDDDMEQGTLIFPLIFGSGLRILVLQLHVRSARLPTARGLSGESTKIAVTLLATLVAFDRSLYSRFICDEEDRGCPCLLEKVSTGLLEIGRSGADFLHENSGLNCFQEKCHKHRQDLYGVLFLDLFD